MVNHKRAIFRHRFSELIVGKTRKGAFTVTFKSKKNGRVTVQKWVTGNEKQFIKILVDCTEEGKRWEWRRLHG